MQFHNSAMSIVLSSLLAFACLPHHAFAQEVVSETPPRQALPAASAPAPVSNQPCPKGKRGGAIGGIVVASVFWPLLPMSIPVLITQSRKLRAHNDARDQGRCQYQRN